MNNPLSEIAEEYTKLEERLRELKRKLYDTVIKYLIENSADLDKCTELAISENLGIRRSLVRSMLKELHKLRIVECVEVGRSKPYVIESIGMALDVGFVSFTREELNRILKIKEGTKLKGSFMFHPGVCKSGVCRYRGRGERRVLKTLVGRFFNYLYANFYEKCFTLKEIEKINLLLPEADSLNLLFEETLPYLPGLFIRLSPELIEAKPDEILRHLREETSEKIKCILACLKRFMKVLEEMGYEGLVEWSKKQKIFVDVVKGFEEEYKVERYFRKEYVWAVTLLLREACKFAEAIGVDKSLIEEALRICDILDLAVEKEYKGYSKEGMNLLEWYKKICGK